MNVPADNLDRLPNNVPAVDVDRLSNHPSRSQAIIIITVCHPMLSNTAQHSVYVVQCLVHLTGMTACD